MHLQPKSDPCARALRPSLSIIIPSLVADTELRRCVDSIRLVCPEREQCEVVVVVPSRRVLEVQALLPYETVVPETRPSIYAAMNDGVAASTGRYLYFIGKDDILLPPLAQALQVLADHHSSALFCDVYWGSRGVYSGKPSRWRVLVRNFCHQGIIYGREVLDRHGPYNRKMRVQADHLLNIRLLWDRELAGRVRYLRQPLAWYSGAGFSTTNRDPVFWRLYPAVMRRHVGRWAALVLLASRKLRGR
jgi:glycosyltransferase involved in cell wall biosynthesis